MNKIDNLMFEPVSPMLNPVLLGHKDCENIFLSAIKSDHCHHAWLLSGPRGIGKFTFACRVARFIFSTVPPVENKEVEFWKTKPVNKKITNDFDNVFNFDDTEDIKKSEFVEIKREDNLKVIDNSSFRFLADTLQIDENNEIFNKIRLGTFSDLKIISPDTENNKKDISIDSIRKIYDFFHVSSSLHDYRVVIIDSVDDLNVNSANALLKILEEPPPKTLFLLVCHNINNLLDTIKSRSRILTFKPLKDELIERLLYENIKNIDTSVVNDLVFLSSGSIGDAYNLYNSDYIGMVKNIGDLLKSLSNDFLGNIIGFASDLEKNNYKFLTFKKIILKIIYFAIQINLGLLDINLISQDLKNILEIVLSNYTNVDCLIDLKNIIENLFYKCDEVNLDRESVIILTLKYISKGLKC